MLSAAVAGEMTERVIKSEAPFFFKNGAWAGTPMEQRGLFHAYFYHARGEGRY